MPILRIPKPLQKVFHLTTPLHLLGKLHWEIRQFRRSNDRKSLLGPLLPSYHAFNCAVTAWHVSDWIWEYDPIGLRDVVPSLKLRKFELKPFQDAIARDCRALNACREIANGSKHRIVTRKDADPLVIASAHWAELKPGKHGNERYGTAWLITDREGTREAVDVFMEAAAYWSRFLTPWMEDRLVLTNDRSRRRKREASK